MAEKDKEKLIKLKDIMDHFSISKRTVYRWQDAGMPVYRGPGGNRYKLSECVQWYKNNLIKES